MVMGDNSKGHYYKDKTNWYLYSFLHKPPLANTWVNHAN